MSTADEEEVLSELNEPDEVQKEDVKKYIHL